ncbi:heme-degrading domain-containing protein [Cryptosporangium sp. NPDC051539]|uniref:heme-degrading domain-containing protein n=1 Tax=Cryptosporangium sp. NPDC051539 TaxID=3363962 RepID=UPI0037B53632
MSERSRRERSDPAPGEGALGEGAAGEGARGELAALLAEEQRLVFPRFDERVAWELGSALRSAADAASLPVAIAIRRGRQQLFHTALPGASADNDGWLERKAAVVERYGHSSYYVGCLFRAGGGDFDTDSRLDTGAYAAHGGAFPLIVAGSGCIGSIAVSGLPQVDDHQFVVAHVARFLGLAGAEAREGGFQ